MSEDKTEEPTSKKLEDARKEGQLPQNKNILEAILLTFGMLITFGISSQLSQNVAGVFDAAILSISGNLENGFGPVMDAAWLPFQASLNIAFSLGALILMVNLLLTRFNFTIKALEPKLNKFNPVNGLKQMFSMSIVYNFFRLLTYFIFAGTTLYTTFVDLSVTNGQTYFYVVQSVNSGGRSGNSNESAVTVPVDTRRR